MNPEKRPINISDLAKKASGYAAFEWAQNRENPNIVKSLYWGAKESILPTLTRLEREIGQGPRELIGLIATATDVTSIVAPTAVSLAALIITRNDMLANFAGLSSKLIINGAIHWKLDALSEKKDLATLQPILEKKEEPDESPATGEPLPGSIWIQYSGLFSENISWNVNLLKELGKVTDFRSHLAIRSGLERNRASAVNLGEVLAWRKFANPMELLQTFNQKKKESTIRSSSQTGEVEVIINDQIIGMEVREKNEGKLDKEVFVSKLDNVVREDLADVIKWEKKTQLLLNPVRAATELTLLGGVGYGLYRLVDSLIGVITSPSSPSSFLNFALTFVGVDVFLSCSTVILKAYRRLSNRSFPGYRAPDDFNPFKHLKNMSEGISLLQKAEGELVYLKDEDHKNPSES